MHGFSPVTLLLVLLLGPLADRHAAGKLGEAALQAYRTHLPFDP